MIIKILNSTKSEWYFEMIGERLQVADLIISEDVLYFVINGSSKPRLIPYKVADIKDSSAHAELALKYKRVLAYLTVSLAIDEIKSSLKNDLNIEVFLASEKALKSLNKLRLKLENLINGFDLQA